MPFKKGDKKLKNAYSYPKGHPNYRKTTNKGKHWKLSPEALKNHYYGSGFKKGHGLINGGNLGKHWKVKDTSNLKGICGEKSNWWRGDNVGYCGVHTWVKKHKGTPDTCEHCGISGLKGRQIHWANIDHKYRRVLEDYIRLCISCHTKYDYENNKGKNFSGRVKETT